MDKDSCPVVWVAQQPLTPERVELMALTVTALQGGLTGVGGGSS